MQRGKVERRMHHIMEKILCNALAMIAQTFCILILKKQAPCHTKLYFCYEKPFTTNLYYYCRYCSKEKFKKFQRENYL